RTTPSETETRVAEALPPPPPAAGPLAIRVIYPPEARRETIGDSLIIYARDRFQSRDSAFFLGSVGRGGARLTGNGMPVPVYPTGGWIAWVALPNDTVATFELVATSDSTTHKATFIAYTPVRFKPPVATAWIDSTSFSPSGARWARGDEGVRLSVRAAPG